MQERPERNEVHFAVSFVNEIALRSHFAVESLDSDTYTLRSQLRAAGMQISRRN